MLSTHHLDTGFKKGKENLYLIRDLNMEVQKGSCYAILGRNGSGKTTLIRTLAGFHPALAGEINIGNKKLESIGIHALALQMAVVHTERFHLSYFTVFDLVALGRHPYTGYGGKLRQADLDSIHQALEISGTQELSNRKISELSDGEHQKVMLARALAQETSMIILDEPTAHLDPINRLEVFRLLKMLSENHGKTVIFSSHELDSALEVADRALILKGDETAHESSPEQLIKSGLIAGVFSKQGVIFDEDSGRFRFE